MIDSMARAALAYIGAGYRVNDAIDRAIADTMVSNNYPAYIFSRVAAKVCGQLTA